MIGLLSTGIRTHPTRRVSFSYSRIVGIAQTDQALLVALYTRGSVFGRPTGPTVNSLRGGVYYLIAYRKTTGQQIAKRGVGNPIVMPIQVPPRAIDAGVSLLTIADDTCYQCEGRKEVLTCALDANLGYPDEGSAPCGACKGTGHNASPRLVPYRFTFKDVHAHLGLTVLEAVNYDNQYFDHHIRTLRAERIEKQVRKEVEQLELESQPTTPPTLGSGT